MKTFILFLFGVFETHEEIENFCFDVLGRSTAVKNLRFVIEDEKNIIVIFDSELGRHPISKELHSILTTDIIKFYFLFERESIYSVNLPVEMKDFIFKPKENNTSLKIEYLDSEIKKNKNLKKWEHY